MALVDQVSALATRVGGEIKAVRSWVTTQLAGKAALTESVNAVSASGAIQTLPGNSVATMHDITLTANCALTFPVAASGASFTLVLRQDTTGGRTVTWPNATRWAGGVAPALSTSASAIDTLSFLCVNGTHWQGFLAGKGMA